VQATTFGSLAVQLFNVKVFTSDRSHDGLQVTCRLDRRKYPTGRKVTDEEIKQVNLKKSKFHGEWNYTIHPSTQ
jgi:hypothetical protein